MPEDKPVPEGDALSGEDFVPFWWSDSAHPNFDSSEPFLDDLSDDQTDRWGNETWDLSAEAQAAEGMEELLEQRVSPSGGDEQMADPSDGGVSSKPVPREADPEISSTNTQEVVEAGPSDVPEEPDRMPVTQARDLTGKNLKQRFLDQRQERVALDLDDAVRDLDDLTGPALSAEVVDYGRLPKMDYGEAEPSSFYAKISWNGSAYEWFTVTPDATGWSGSETALSSKGAPEGNKTADPAYHENLIANLPSDLIVRMFRYGSFYIFRTTLENNLPRAVLKPDPSGSKEAVDGVAWRIDNQAGNAGFILPISTETGYNESGDEVLYGYFAALEVSVDGRIVAVSIEKRYTINEPDDC